MLAAGSRARSLARPDGRWRPACHPTRRLGRAPSPRPRLALRLHVPDLDSIHTMSPAAEELTRVIQGTRRLCAALDELGRRGGRTR